MIPVEEIGDYMCQPKAVIDALDHLGIALTEEQEDKLFQLRVREIGHLSEESDYYNTPEKVADYDLERINYAIQQFQCVAVPATLYALDEFIKATTVDQAVIAKVKSERGSNHVEHIRLVRNDGRIFGNTRDFEWPEFERQIQERAQTAGFNVIFIRRNSEGK